LTLSELDLILIAHSEHFINDPISEDKLRSLGEQLRLGPNHEILDLASGSSGPAIVLAQAFGSRFTCVDWSPSFIRAAREQIQRRGLAGLIEVIEADARTFVFEAERYDVVMCLGASWIFNGMPDILKALAPCVKPGGHVVVGEVYRMSEAEPATDVFRFSFHQLLDQFDERGLPVVAYMRASEDDWDRYQSEAARNYVDWLEAHPNHPDAAQVEAVRRLRSQRAAEGGWAIVAGRKSPHV
jgi:ubiquinone/menaquinone biosynthesis C-methylase UbiE